MTRADILTITSLIPQGKKLFIPALIILLLLLVSFADRTAIAATTAEPSTFQAEASPTIVTLVGFTRARARIKMTAQVTGILLEVRGEVGDTIGVDGIFARIDPIPTELELTAIRVNQDKLRSKIAYLEKEVGRYQTLFDQHSTAESRLDALKEDLSQARLGLAELQTEERKTEEILSRHTINAPPGWRVISRLAEPEEWVNTGTSLGEVGDYRSLLVPFAVSQEEYRRLTAVKGKIKLRLPEWQISVPATLARVSPEFDEVTRKINLELEIGGKLPARRGGLRAELDLELPDPSGALLVPASAVLNRYDSSWLTTPAGDKIMVIVLGSGNKPETLRVSGKNIRPGERFLTAPSAAAGD
jgi:RND family efflux transporter MFP subunit